MGRACAGGACVVVRAYREGRLEQHALVGGEESLVIEYLADTRLLAPVDARVEACVDSVGPIDEGGVGAHEAGEQVVWYGLEAARTVAHPRLHLPEYAPQLLRMGRDSAECPGEWEWEWGWEGRGGWGAGGLECDTLTCRSTRSSSTLKWSSCRGVPPSRPPLRTTSFSGSASTYTRSLSGRRSGASGGIATAPAAEASEGRAPSDELCAAGGVGCASRGSIAPGEECGLCADLSTLRAVPAVFGVPSLPSGELAALVAGADAERGTSPAAPSALVGVCSSARREDDGPVSLPLVLGVLPRVGLSAVGAFGSSPHAREMSGLAALPAPLCNGCWAARPSDPPPPFPVKSAASAAACETILCSVTPAPRVSAGLLTAACAMAGAPPPPVVPRAAPTAAVAVPPTIADAGVLLATAANGDCTAFAAFAAFTAFALGPTVGPPPPPPPPLEMSASTALPSMSATLTSSLSLRSVGVPAGPCDLPFDASCSAGLLLHAPMRGRGAERGASHSACFPFVWSKIAAPEVGVRPLEFCSALF